MEDDDDSDDDVGKTALNSQNITYSDDDKADEEMVGVGGGDSNNELIDLGSGNNT